MIEWARFSVYVVVSAIVFSLFFAVVLRTRNRKKLFRKFVKAVLLVIVAGMLFAKLGQNMGLPWWIYYTVPMLVTVFFPPVYFKMGRREVSEYLVLSFLSAPLIHFLFSFFFGWKDYMPFIDIPSMWELL